MPETRSLILALVTTVFTSALLLACNSSTTEIDANPDSAALNSGTNSVNDIESEFPESTNPVGFTVLSVSQPVVPASSRLVTSLVSSHMNDSGTIAAVFSVSDPQQNESNELFGPNSGFELWKGTPGNFKPVLTWQSEFDGLSADKHVALIGSVGLSSDDEIAANITLNDQFGDNAIVVSQGDTVKVILQNGDLAPGFSSSHKVTDLGLVQRVRAGVLLQGVVNNDIRAIWFWNNQTFELIASGHPQDENINGVAFNDCVIQILNTAEGENRAFINEEGAIAFDARLVSGPSDVLTDECYAMSVMHYKEGVYTKVANTDIEFEGAQNATVFATSLIDIAEDGSVLSFQDIDIQSNPPVFESTALVINKPPHAATNLVAFMGEKVPPEYTSALYWSNNYSAKPPQINSRDEVLLVAEELMPPKTTLLVGPGHGGQPYSDLTNVGSSSLRHVASDQMSVPSEYPETAYLDNIRSARLKNDGAVVFIANLKDAADPELSATMLWESMSDGTLRKVIAVNDPIEHEERLIKVTALENVVDSALNRNTNSVLVSDAGILVRVHASSLSNDLVNANTAGSTLVFIPNNNRVLSAGTE